MLVLFVCFLVYLLLYTSLIYTVNCYYVSNCETVGSVVVIMYSAGLHVFLNAVVACHYIL